MIIVFIFVCFMLFFAYISYSQTHYSPPKQRTQLKSKNIDLSISNVINSKTETTNKLSEQHQSPKHWLDKSKILPCGFMMAAICCMFPPYYAPFKNGTAVALGNQFILNTPYYYYRGSSIKGIIDTSTLAAELLIIIFSTAAIYFYANKK